MQHMRAQAERFGATLVAADVTRVDLSARPVPASGSTTRSTAPSSVIISTGASARWLDLPEREPPARLRRLDLRHLRRLLLPRQADGRGGRRRLRHGGGAASWRAWPRSVTIVHRRDEFRASRIMVERAMANEKIHVRWNAEVEEVVGDGQGRGGARARHRDRRARGHPGRGDVRGHRPRPQHRRCSPARSSWTRPGTSSPTARGRASRASSPAATSRTRSYKQAITAAGSGCMAAMDAERWLEASATTTTTAEPAGALATGKDGD